MLVSRMGVVVLAAMWVLFLIIARRRPSAQPLLVGLLLVMGCAALDQSRALVSFGVTTLAKVEEDSAVLDKIQQNALAAGPTRASSQAALDSYRRGPQRNYKALRDQAALLLGIFGDALLGKTPPTQLQEQLTAGLRASLAELGDPPPPKPPPEN